MNAELKEIITKTLTEIEAQGVLTKTNGVEHENLELSRLGKNEDQFHHTI